MFSRGRNVLFPFLLSRSSSAKQTKCFFEEMWGTQPFLILYNRKSSLPVQNRKLRQSESTRSQTSCGMTSSEWTSISGKANAYRSSSVTEQGGYSRAHFDDIYIYSICNMTSGLFSWAKSAWRRANYFRYVTLLSMTADLIHLWKQATLNTSFYQPYLNHRGERGTAGISSLSPSSEQNSLAFSSVIFYKIL